jgi:Eco57I restriction-modification methylase
VNSHSETRTPDDFLADQEEHFAWQVSERTPAGLGLSPIAAFSGRGNHPLEVALATTSRRPRADEFRQAWSARHGNAPNPLLLVGAYRDDGGWKASICGPAGDDPPVETGLELGEVERIAAAALAEPTRHAAIRFVASIWAELENELPGLRNQGMFATHDLRDGVPSRHDWTGACSRGQELLPYRGRDLVERLGFSIEAHATAASVLNIAGTKRAIAVFLDEGEEFETAVDRFAGSSPVSHALAVADRESLPWVVITRGRQIRVYAARGETGVGRKGRSETFVEANLALLPNDRAGYLPLLFSADALRELGTFDEILEGSRDYSADLGARLRERVYTEAVPSLGIALARRHRGALDEVVLRQVYEQALTVLFRLLFVAYAEDKDLLPYRSNGAYREHALKTLARDLADRSAQGPLLFDQNSTDLWDDVAALWLAIDKGNVERGVPPYNGGLFSGDAGVNRAGAGLAGVRLANAEFGPALAAMLVDEAADGLVGPVDFRSLSVREFGTIYEGLLESSLSVAPSDLTVDKRKSYIPAGAGDEIFVSEGEVYFHDRSGARKATGSYFTKPFAVEHLLDHALERALDDHLARLEALLGAGEEAQAAEAFFDFRCVDLAMGSGHFLVAAVDRIEARLSAFLALHPIPQVTAELDRLRKAALTALGPLGEGVEIEHASLLRRQVARRAVYGVDVNPIAVELARLGIWIHTFVPGLPLSFLDHSLVCGDSLTGVGTLDEAVGALEPEHVPGQASLFRDQILAVLGRAESALQRLAHISESSKAEIDAAREAQHDAEEAVGPARDLFDLIVAARLEETSPLHAFREDELAANADLPGARELCEELNALHFPIAFPEVFLRERPGFDCILGNPPWDKVRFEPQQFWVSRVPGLNALAAPDREARIGRLRAERPADATAEGRERLERERLQLLAETAFTLQGRGQHGHHDFAKLFTERALSLRSDQGTVGYVLPRQVLVLGGWKHLREALVADASVTTTQCRNRAGWLFEDVHFQYMVVLVTRRPQLADEGVVNVIAGVDSVTALKRAGTGVRLTASEIGAISDDSVIPWLNAGQDYECFEKMWLRPRLGSGEGWISADVASSLWDFSGSGPHRSFVATSASPGCWRVLMTRHVDQWLITDDPFRRYLPRPLDLVPLGRGIVDDDGVAHVGPAHPVLVFRYPSMADNTRTLLATAIPHEGFLFSKGYVHGIRNQDGVTTERLLALLAYLNSFIADWWVRRFVDRHVTKPVLVHLPLPDWSSDEIDSAARTAWEMLARNGLSVMAGGRTIARHAALGNLSEHELIARIEHLTLQGFDMEVGDLRSVLSDFSNEACPDPLQALLLADS